MATLIANPLNLIGETVFTFIIECLFFSGDKTAWNLKYINVGLICSRLGSHVNSKKQQVEHMLIVMSIFTLINYNQENGYIIKLFFRIKSKVMEWTSILPPISYCSLAEGCCMLNI